MEQIKIAGSDFFGTRNYRGDIEITISDPFISDEVIEELIKIITPDRILSALSFEQIRKFAQTNEFSLVIDEATKIINGEVKIADSWSSNL